MTPTITARPFPWKRGYSRQRAVQPTTIPYSLEMEHDLLFKGHQ